MYLFVVLGAGFPWLLLFSFSLIVVVVSGVMISSGLGGFCSSSNLLFVAKLGEENDSSCCCVVGIESVSGITVGLGSGCVSGIMCGSSVGFSDICFFCIVGFPSLVVGWSLLVIGSCAGSFLDMWVIVFVIFR